MTRAEYSRHSRRRGQALLLAVLVMVFAALIGLTFITVVSINIGQTGREEERDKAKQAASAGLAFANLQLTQSVWGTKWRPDNPAVGGSTPPTYTNSFYWTPFDIAQNWSVNTVNTNPSNGQIEGNFVKFPDPRSTNASLNAPNYMVKVEKVGTDPVKDADNANGDKTGMIRITAIGLSSDDRTSFYKQTGYKNGPAQQPFTGAMRSVSNWDFQNETVPSATTANTGSTSTTATSTMTLTSLNGQMANKTNFYVTISSVTGADVRYAVVASCDAGGTTLTLAPTPTSPTVAASPAPPSITWAAGERVEIAAGLGAPPAIDFNNNLTADATNEGTDFSVSTASTPGSVKVSGGLVWLRRTSSLNLRDPSQATATAAAGTIEASGVIFTNPIDTADTTNNSIVAGVLQGGTSITNRTLLSSSDTDFPFTGTGTSTQKLRLIKDGLNRITNSPDSTRQVQPFTPPNITKGGEGFGRYRQLTKYSEPATSGDPAQAGAYGRGKGIYINNPQDKERSTLTAEMTQAQLQSLWFDTAGTGSNFLRAGTPLGVSDAAASLEQQHLRGWIAPDEFLPRGVLIEINPDATLTITLDSITDGAGTMPGTSERYNEGPVPDKSWRDAYGDLDGGSTTLGGVYRRTNVAWPANGVIFAEGNVRIRGKATSATPTANLTVVSMNNIYIEGSLKAGSRKVLLLARRNVVVNPTRIIGRPQAQTRAVAVPGSPSGTVNLKVRDASLFSKGDRILIGSGTTYRQVKVAPDLINNKLLLDSAPGTAPTDTTVVSLQRDPTNFANSLPYYNRQTPYLRAESQAMQRRFWTEGTPGAVRVAMRHGGAEKMAFSLRTTGVAAPSNLRLGNKFQQPDPTTPPLQVTSADKQLTIANEPAPPAPPFPASPGANTTTVNSLVTALNSRYSSPYTWSYNAVALNSYGTVPYRYLAGIGLRYKFDAAVTPPTFPFRELLTGTAKEFPMATSVKLLINGDDGALETETGTGAYSTVTQFGFNPDFNGLEDAITVDRRFYNTYGNSSLGTNVLIDKLTTDSRRIANNLNSDAYNTLTWRFHDDAIDPYFATLVNPLPFYGVDRAKLENLDQYNGSYAFEKLDTGYTLDINAYVYAQEGSWFVIPGVYFDERLKTNSTGSYMDYDNDTIADAGEYLDSSGDGAFTAGEGPDLNHDGVYSRSDQLSVYRFLRHNYKIKFTGAIMENNTALVEDPDGTGALRGPVADWTDKWATVKTSASLPVNNFSGVGQNDTFLPGTMTTTNGNFATIEYNFDPQAALDNLTTTDGFEAPISPELVYQTG